MHSVAARSILLLLLFGFSGCDRGSADRAAAQPPAAAAQRQSSARGQAQAIFAGGCFWCTEADFEKLAGVTAAVSGYTGGRVANPNYEQVSAGGTGHYEAVRVTYDPRRVSYAALVRHFYRTIDPTDGGGQFCDRGESYRSAIFVRNADERRIAQAAAEVAKRQLGGRLVTPVLAAAAFYPAEDYHQDYYKKNPVRYRYYRYRCGRDARLSEVWGRK